MDDVGVRLPPDDIGERMVTVKSDRKDLIESFNTLKEGIMKAEKEGMRTSLAKEKLKLAASAFKSKDFDGATTLLDECKEELDRILRGQTVKEMMNIGDCLIRTADILGIDTSQAVKGMETVEKHLESEEYMEALQLATITIGTVDSQCRSRVEELLKKVNPMILEARADHIEVLTVEALYQRAKEFERKHQYDKAARYAKRCFDELEEIKDMSQRAASVIRLAEANVLQAKFFGANVGGPVQMMLDEAYYELKNGQFETSIKLGKECIEMVTQAKENVVWDTVLSFQSMIGELKNGGTDYSKAEKLIEDAITTLKNKDYTAALELLIQSERETGKSEWQDGMLTDLIAGMDAMINEAEERGISGKAAKGFHRKAESAVRNKRYPDALESVIESGFELSEAQETYVKAKTLLLAASVRLGEANTLLEGMDRVKDLLSSAEKAFAEKDYDSAIRMSKEVISDIKKATASDLHRPIKDAEELIEIARTLNLDTTRACAIIDEARFALEDELYSQVKLFAQNCRKVLEREISGSLYKNLYELRKLMQKVSGNGGDVSGAESLLNEAEECLDNKEYPTAAEHLNKVNEMLSR